MIVIYAEKGDMGCKFAAALGGIPYNGKNITIKEYESLSSDKQKAIQKKGYIETEYKSKKFVVTWGAGHFGTLLEPRDIYPDTKWQDYNLPIIPDKFRVKLREKANNYQFNIVKELFNRSDCEYIISATDFEREGELIFAYTYELTGSTKPYKRVRINETTEEGIKKGFSKRYSGIENLPKEAGARVRGVADWITGMNLTISATTKFNNGIINLGRVITPTLAMIVNLEEEINNFVSKPFYNISGDFTMPDGTVYKGKYSEVFEIEEEAKTVLSKIPSSATVKSVEKKKGKKMPDKPFDTATLQKEANKKYKMSLKEIDDIAQKLYTKGYITYPRVDSRYLKEEQQSELPAKINNLKTISEYADIINKLSNIEIPSQYFNDKKVDGHHAIIITGNIPKGLSEDEWKIYDLIAKQTIALAFPPLLLEKTKVITSAGEYDFATSGTIVIDPGWTVVGFESEYKNDVPASIKEGINVKGGYSIVEGKTTPPQRYTPGSLVRAMEICGRKVKGSEEKKLLEKMKGLGRPSTRAAIVERLKTCEYIEIKKNIIHPTQRGVQVIKTINIETLKSPEMSAEWEKRIDEIEQSSSDDCMSLASTFVKDISKQTSDWVKQISNITGNITKGDALPCPICGNCMTSAKYSFMCACGFKINKEIASYKLTKKDVESIIKNGRTPFITSFKSKEGKDFSAYLVLNKEEKQLSFSKDSLLRCPKCGQPLRPFNSQKGYYCAGWKQDGSGCDFNIFVNMYGRKLKSNELIELIKTGQTKELSLKKKDGSNFKAAIGFDEMYKPKLIFKGGNNV